MKTEFNEDVLTIFRLQSQIVRQISTDLIRLTINSVTKNKYEILLDINERPIGYVLWADINIESLQQLRKTRIFPAYSYEWDEGDITLILDILLLLNRNKTIFQVVRSFARDRKKVAYVKNSKLFFSKATFD